MTPVLRIGDPVQVHAETEVLILISVDGADAWCRDGAGGHVQYRLEDLERAHSRAHREANDDVIRRQQEELDHHEPSLAEWQAFWESKKFGAAS